MTHYELVDWTPAKHPTIRLGSSWKRKSRRLVAFQANMHLRKVGTTYIHNGKKPR